MTPEEGPVMRIDHLKHSGFLVETDKCLLLFDYYKGDLSMIDERDPEKTLFVFVSHAHEDHFSRKIFLLGGRRIKYIISFDVDKRAVPEDKDVLFVDADETYEIDGLGRVETFLSTDEGVAFLVDTGSEKIFHAGDLHWWDWEGEPEDWLKDQEIVFKREIGKLAGKELDAAFVVLDDRLEDNFYEGMAWFLKVCKARYVLPMHFWEDKKIIERFKALPGADKYDTIILDTVNEDRWEI